MTLERLKEEITIEFDWLETIFSGLDTYFLSNRVKSGMVVVTQ